MFVKRKAAFDTIQPLFQAAEQATDQAATDTAVCIAEMLKARQDANLPMSVGTEMLDKMVQALAAGVDARKHFIEAHALTPTVVKEIGLEKAFGDIHPCPRTRANGELTVVPQAFAA
ncbi:hypothetical protein SAMN05428974_1314 [Sphingopyxis sp. YR583]|uniref:hypothetical protein n=1 Tax=Sphingopyxis sp. YR583 TaxID=1881047 RepID=UPI0008A7FA1E|nr:hypothetical protein [Sphingopyxis sp. YR583]SEH14949.1 hypothetical protein SAMN05428974_1314 [Sphingopyxis sp. YR583]